jgi:hypothetical protein
MKYDNIIAIDPDCAKSGVAFLKVKEKKLEASNLSFPQLLDYLKFVHQERQRLNETVIVIVEAGWLNTKSNFGGYNRYGAQSVGERIAKNVGANQQTGKLIIESCKHYNIPVEEVRPLKKFWKGPGGKITQKELASFTGIDRRMNQDLRDSVLLAWHYAGLPIKMKV